MGTAFTTIATPDLRADFILANPPFNVSDWGGERLTDDKRWQYGVPPKGNANFAWVQHMVHHLAPGGAAGFVLANGSMSSNQSGEGEIQQEPNRVGTRGLHGRAAGATILFDSRYRHVFGFSPARPGGSASSVTVAVKSCLSTPVNWAAWPIALTASSRKRTSPASPIPTMLGEAMRAQRNTPTFPDSARAQRWTRCAKARSCADSRAVTWVLNRRRTTASRSGKR